MRLLHLGDLHIGKRVNEVLMLEEQKFALKQVLDICEEKQVQAVMIAGDIYDRSVPVAEAVTILSDFLSELCSRNIEVFAISGNHDSAVRLEFGKNIFKNKKIYIEGSFNGKIEKITEKDEYGNINFYLLPYINLSEIKAEDTKEFESYTEGFDYLIKNTDINKNERNIILSHQFITKGEEEPDTCKSESVSIGGLDNIDYSVFNAFDYVALGHLHRPQRIGREEVRYSGSLIKYSFSEVNDIKSVPLIEIKEKGNLNIELIPLKPLRDMRNIKGKIEDLLKMEGDKDDYIRAVITNEEEIFDAVGQLRGVYPNLMKIEFENKKSVYNENSNIMAESLENKSPEMLFAEFFEIQNNVEMNEEQKQIVLDIFKEIGEDNNETD